MNTLNYQFNVNSTKIMYNLNNIFIGIFVILVWTIKASILF